MKIIFLGTNGWYTNETGDTACILIDAKDQYVIFDAGNGLYKIDKYITKDKPISLFISHFHIDHISGFHTLAKFTFSQGIDIYFAKGRKKDFDLFVHRPYTIGIKYEKENIHNLSTKIRLHELEVGKHTVGFPVQISKLLHAYEDHGYRIILENKTVVYSGDTGITPTSKTLAENADLLIHECSLLKPEKTLWGHVDALEAAQLAKEADVKQLVLTHFDPSLYPNLDDRTTAEQKAQKIFSNTIAARDDMILEI